MVVYAPETQRVMQFRKLTKCWLCTLCKHDNAHIIYKTSQELRILSSVTLNCQVTKIVMKSGSQFSILLSVCQISQVSRISLRVLSKCIYLCHCLCLFIYLCHCPFLFRSCLLITLIKCLKGHKALRSLFEGVL